MTVGLVEFLQKKKEREKAHQTACDHFAVVRVTVYGWDHFAVVPVTVYGWDHFAVVPVTVYGCDHFAVVPVTVYGCDHFAVVLMTVYGRTCSAVVPGRLETNWGTNNEPPLTTTDSNSNTDTTN